MTSAHKAARTSRFHCLFLLFAHSKLSSQLDVADAQPHRQQVAIFPGPRLFVDLHAAAGHKGGEVAKRETLQERLAAVVEATCQGEEAAAGEWQPVAVVTSLKKL